MTTRPALFATGLTIKNFRGYGGFHLELPPEPCVVLLSGPNGLGKTSFFEALEWSLTDAVKRLDMVSGGRADPHDLVRRAPGVDSFEVGISFVDGDGKEERISRTQIVPGKGVSPSVGTDLNAVAQLLSSDEARWKVTGENLSSYLHLTHLHAQVAALRLVTFKSRERWLRVSPLAGAERFDRVRVSLTNSKQALTKLRDRRGEALEFARRRQSQFVELTLRLTQAQRLATLTRDVVSPREVVKMVREILAPLDLPIPRSISTTDDVVAAGETLLAFRAALDQAAAELDARAKGFARLRLVVRQASELSVQREKLLGLESRLEAEGLERRKRVDQFAAQLQVAREMQSKCLQQRDALAARHDRYVQVLAMRGDLPRLEAEAKDADAAVRSYAAALENAEVDLRRQRDEFAAFQALHEGRERSRQAVQAAIETLDAIEQIDALNKQLLVEQDQLSILNDSLLSLARNSESISAELAIANIDAERLDQELVVLRASTEALQGALAVVAEHVSERDTTCPICATAFEPGGLRERVLKALSAFDPKLAEADARLSKARAKRKTLETSAQLLSLERRKLAADVKPVTDKIAQLSARIEGLRRLPLIEGRATGDARIAALAARELLTKEVARFDRDLAATSGGLETLQQAIVDAIARRDSARRQLTLEQERYGSRIARLSEGRARMKQLAGEDPAVDVTESALRTLIEQVARELSLARDAADEAAAKYAESHAAEVASRKGLEALREEFQKARSQRSQVDAAVLQQESEWQKSRLSLPISDATLDAAEERDALRRAQLDSGAQVATSLSASLTRWQEAVDLQRLEEEVLREQGTRTRDEHAMALEAAVVRAQKEFDDAERARSAADELGDMLLNVTAEFGERSLKPFGDLFRRYLRALVHDERFHRIEAVYESAARSAGLNFRVDFGGAPTEAEHILSEGQLGEVSLAAMLAASTAFPWSRWRALLLDDPTQYNDLIHATALFDVLRNLVRFAKHQIFISTHDNEQAAFFRRKLDAVDIRWIDCRFHANTADGIETEVVHAASKPAAERSA